MRILMFTWEFPPLISGGLGTACYGMVKALLKNSVEVDLVLPTKEEVYFPMRKPEDVDLLPVSYLGKKGKKKDFKNVEEKIKYLGLKGYPETYINFEEVESYHKYLTYFKDKEKDELEIIKKYLKGEEDIFSKIKEYTIRAYDFAEKLKFDLIHVHDWLTYPAGVVAKKASGKKLVAHIHATEFDRSSISGDERIHRIEHAGMHAADAVIAVSRYTSNLVFNQYRIDLKKLHIVYNAHEHDFDVLTKKKKFKGPVILFLGRITLQKGPDYFLEVGNRIVKKHSDAKFIMAGSGDMENQIIHRSAYYKLKNNFLFTGFLKRQDVFEIFSFTDIYVLTSVSEPFGIAPLEAMSFGIPAIISSRSGVAEVVDNAIKIDFWDIDRLTSSIEYLINNPQKRKEIGEKSKKEVETIRWQTASEKIKKIYRGLL